MKKLFSVSIAALLLAFTGFSYAEENPEGLKFWFDVGTQSGDVSFEESSPNSWISKLEYEADTVVFGIGTSYQFLNSKAPRLSIGAYGLIAHDCEGIQKDTDYFAPGYNTDVYSEADQNGDHDRWEVWLGYEVFKSADQKIAVDVQGGYYVTSYDFEMDNVSQIGTNATSTVVGITNRYELRMKGNFVGLNGKYTINEKLNASASYKWFPRFRADGKGQWFLRDLRFDQDATGNHGAEFNLGVDYQPAEGWSFGLYLNMTDLKTDKEKGGSQNFRGYGADSQHTRIEYGANDINFIEIDTYSVQARIKYNF